MFESQTKLPLWRGIWLFVMELESTCRNFIFFCDIFVVILFLYFLSRHDLLPEKFYFFLLWQNICRHLLRYRLLSVFYAPLNFIFTSHSKERERKNQPKSYFPASLIIDTLLFKRKLFLLLLMYCLWPFSTPAPFTDQSRQVWTLK